MDLNTHLHNVVQHTEEFGYPEDAEVMRTNLACLRRACVSRVRRHSASGGAA